MSDADRPMPPLLPRDRMESVRGWAESVRSVSYVYRPSTIGGIREVFDRAREWGLHVGLRGAGRSYGDASLAAEHLTLDLSRMNRILDWNPETGVLKAEPGVTIRQVWEHVIEDGWWPPVVPGTMFVTLGGAAAMNIHGKNHWHVGTLGENITEFDFLLPNGDHLTCRPRGTSLLCEGENCDLFRWALGSFGTLGVFTSLTLPMKRIHSGLLRATRWVARDLSEMFAVLDERVERATYLVGWIDALATGSQLGRGLIEQADELAPGEDPAPDRTRRVSFQTLPDTIFGWFPKSLMWRLARPWVNPGGVRMANAAQYLLGARGSGKMAYETYSAVNFKLDYVPEWKRAYGRYGLIQYQIFVPKETAQATFRRILQTCQEWDLPPFLVVFKRHRPDPFPLSYGGDGYSLALDFPITARNRERLRQLTAVLDPIVLDAGGRFYFAKDSTLDPSRLAAFYAEDRIQKFLALKHELDPENLLQTDLYRRLFPQEKR